MKFLIILTILGALPSCLTIGQGVRTLQVIENKTGKPAANRSLSWRKYSFFPPHYPSYESPINDQLDGNGSITRTFPFTDGIIYFSKSDQPGNFGDDFAIVEASQMRAGGRVDFQFFRTTANGRQIVGEPDVNGIQEIKFDTTHHLLITK